MANTRKKTTQSATADLTLSPNTNRLFEDSVSVDLEADLRIPERAANLSPAESKALINAPGSAATLGPLIAEAMRRAGSDFIAASGTTPEEIERLSNDALRLDRHKRNTERMLDTLKNADRLIEADLWDKLRMVNDLVNIRSKREGAVAGEFKELTAYMKRYAGTAKTAAKKAAKKKDE